MERIKRIYHFVVDSKIPTLSGALCFFLLLNGGSYLFLLVSFSSYFLVDLIPYVEQNMMDGIVKEILIYLFHHQSNLSISIILLATSLYSSSSLYYHFMHICEIITKKPLDFVISKRIQAIILAPILIFLFLALLILLLIAERRIGGYIYILYFILLILFIYIFNKIALRSYTIGGLYKGIIFSSIYCISFTLLFIVYLKIFSSFKVVYGVLSFLIIFLFYLYSITIGLFLGIYMNCKNLEVWNYFFKAK